MSDISTSGTYPYAFITKGTEDNTMTEKESQNQVWIGIKKDIEKLEKKFTDHMTDFQLIFEAIDKIHERLGYLEHPRIEVGLEEKAKSHTDQFVETIRELQKSFFISDKSPSSLLADGIMSYSST